MPPARRPRPLRPLAALACAGALAAGAAAGCGGGVEGAEEAAAQATVDVTLPAPAATGAAPAPAADGAPDDVRAGGPAAATEPRAGEAAASAPNAAPAPARARPRGQLTVHVTRATAVHARPDGPVVARLAPRTPFDSPTVVPVLRRADGWLAIVATELPNGRVGWIRASASLREHRTAYRIDASLSARRVVVRRAGRVVARFPVAVGAPSTPTPRGRFAVTDKLLTNSATSPYGCCILALSGRQTATPQGWGGGDRLAIHATRLPETIGTEASLGCLRAPTDAIRRAVDTVPLGTIVRIRA